MTSPEYRKIDEQGWKELLEHGAFSPFEKEFYRKDGGRVPILIGGALVEAFPVTWLCFVVDLSERKRAELEREAMLFREQAARVEAQEAVRQRNELLAIVSHDLKNPLARIKGYAQLLQRQVASEAGADTRRLLHGLSQIETTATAMNSQINQLVDVTRLQLGEKLNLDRRRTDLVALAYRVADGHQKTTERHRVVVTADVPELVGEWDSDRLERVLGNLLENAIKYSPEGGTIALTLECHASDGGAWAAVTVRDEGMGIPEADLPRIFDRFHRGGNVVGRIPGTGLGLAGVHQIVEQHGGTIEVQSQEGHGSTFTIRLPVDRANSATENH